MKSPQLSYHVDLEVSETVEFKSRISKYFVFLILKGDVVSDYYCKDKQLRRVSDAEVDVLKFKQKNEKILLGSAKTDENGTFVMRLYISRK